jgi:hypothetical protein
MVSRTASYSDDDQVEGWQSEGENESGSDNSSSQELSSSSSFSSCIHDNASTLTTKMQHSSEPLEEFLSLDRAEQEHVWHEIIRKANLYDDMVRLVEEDASSMKHFFIPSERLQDEFDMFSDEVHGYTEVELAVSIEALLNHSWDWSDFRAFSTGDEGEMGKIVWITEDTFFWIEETNNEVDFDDLKHRYEIQRATFTATSGETHDLVLANYRNSRSLSTGAFSVFWHLVKTSNCVKVKLKSAHHRFVPLVFETSPSQLLETSPSLELLEFEGFAFKESGCRALATLVERTSLEVTFEECDFDAQCEKDTFIEWLRHSQGATKLESCRMLEDSMFPSLSGNSSVKSLSIVFLYHSNFNDYHLRSLARALPGNLGIEKLSVTIHCGETASLLLCSLWEHPRIQSVTLDFFPSLEAAANASMMNAVLRLAQCNTVLHTIDLPEFNKGMEIYENAIVPRLEMNRNYFEEQRRVLRRADPSIRGRLLGRALDIVRSNPDLLFRFLSENVPAFVRSDEDGPFIPTG